MEGSRRESSAELEKFPSSYMSVTSYFVKSVTADLTYHRACVDTYTIKIGALGASPSQPSPLTEDLN